MSPTNTKHIELSTPAGHHDDADAGRHVGASRGAGLSLFGRRRRQPEVEEFINIEDRLASF